MNQYEKIKEICADGEYHCQVQFWDNYIRSPHKRRKELEAMGYEFLRRDCQHGLRRSFDYRMVKKQEEKPEEKKELNQLFSYPIPFPKDNINDPN